jgi:hypothetical protein
LKNYEKNSSQAKNANEENIKSKTRSLEDILRTAKEIPTGIALMRGLYKSKKHRCSSQKRKR